MLFCAFSALVHSIKRELLNILIDYNTYIGKNFMIVKNNKTNAEMENSFTVEINQ